MILTLEYVKRDAIINRRDFHKYSDVTHLCFYENNISSMDKNISKCVNVTRLYLHNNILNTIENINLLQNLTHLYLQRNRISSIKCLNYMPSLCKLYLGYNEIAILDGLERMESLQLLHIEHQRLSSENSTLKFDPRTVLQLSVKLSELNIEGNSIVTLEKIVELKNLENINASRNLICNLKETCKQLSEIRNLKVVNLKGNPIAKNKEFYKCIVSALNNLDALDGKEISKNTKIFFKNMQQFQTKNKQKKIIRSSKMILENEEFLNPQPAKFHEKTKNVKNRR